MVPGVVAVELLCSRSVRSSWEVALEEVSRPLSGTGLEIEEAALSDAGRADCCSSMKSMPPVRMTTGSQSTHSQLLSRAATLRI